MAAAKTKTAATKIYNIEVVSNLNFCGTDVSDVQFSHGKAQVTDPWIAEWYRTHDGYKVTEVAETPAEQASPAEDAAAKK